MLGTELANAGKPDGKSNSEKEPTGNQMECGQEKQYQEMPEEDIRMVRDKKILPGTMKEILVQANLGHKGVGLIRPAPGGDLRCIHPKAISLMTEWPLSELEDRLKQWKKNKNRRRFRTYMVYNTSHDTIILPKNKLVGQCQLILQPNKKAYHQELSAMQQERLAENQEEHNSSEADQLL